MSDCPPAERLHAWLDERLDPQEHSTIESHLESCADCQKNVEQLLSAGSSQDTAKTLTYEQPTSQLDWMSSIANRIAQAVATPTNNPSTLADQIPTVEGYEIESMIAHGGMGVVYRAQQVQAQRTVALKMMLQGYYARPEEVARFQLEAKAAAGLTHQYIVPVYDVGISNGQHYFSMGFIDGISCRELLQQGSLPNQDAAELMIRVAEAIAYAHDEGVIHRDLKPGNILLDQEGKPHLTDFGLAKKVDLQDELTATGQVLGTPSFMAPEQALGNTEQVGPLADVYALGALLYNCLTGRPPFQSQTPVETMMQVIEVQPIPPRQLNTSVDLDLQTICLKCLEKDPKNRYPSASAVQQELQRYLEGKPIEARPLSWMIRATRWCRRRPVTAGLIASVAGSLILGTVFSTYFALLAERRAERATQGTRIALSSLETIINTIQSRLRDVAGARQIRRDLLKAALTDLERILADSSFQSQIDQDIANVHVDLGLLYLELGGEQSGGNADREAEAALRKAVGMFDYLVRRESGPGSQLVADRARAVHQLGTFLSELDQHKEAERLLLDALQVRRKLIADGYRPDRMRQVLSRSLWGLSENYFYQGQLDQALETIGEAVEISEQLREEHPENRELRHELSIVYTAAGDYHYDLRHSQQAKEFYELALKESVEISKMFPVNARTHDDLSYCYERLGDYWEQQGDNYQARDSFEKMLAELELAEELDPKDRFLKEGLATAYDKLRLIYTKLGDTKNAKLAQEKRDELDHWLAIPDKD